MNIQEIADTLIRGKKAITFPLQIHNNWVSDAKGHHILDIRGWGFLQYADDEKGAELQDAIGVWVVKTLNEAYEKSKA